jgi:hypothetical protein
MKATGRGRGDGEERGEAPVPRWCVLIHQLPPRPQYLRARIRQRLDRVGAVALKNSVYVLPHTAACLEDFQWLAQEAVAGGGEAFVCASDLVFGLSDEELEERFRRARAADYSELVAAAREALSRLRGEEPAGREEDPAGRLRRLERRLREVIAVDFFAAPERAQAEAAVHALAARVQPAGRKRASTGRRSQAELVGKTWVTRKGVHVDRIASAWLVRRFVDPAARFRFVDAQEVEPAAGEIRFDMVNAELTHRGNRCTFEGLVATLGLRDPAVRDLAEIVHDIDLKDDRFGRAEAAGVEQLIAGLCRACPADDERLERGLQLFDDLYSSYSRPKPGPAGRRRGRAGTGGDG